MCLCVYLCAISSRQTDRQLVSVTLAGNLLTLPQLQVGRQKTAAEAAAATAACQLGGCTLKNPYILECGCGSIVACCCCCSGCLLLLCQHPSEQQQQEQQQLATTTHVRLNLGVCRRTYAALTTNLHSRRLAKATYNPSRLSSTGESKTQRPSTQHSLKSKMSYLTAQIFHFTWSPSPSSSSTRF